MFEIVLSKTFEGLVWIDCGSAFHNFEAEYEKELSYNAVRDLGTKRSPFSDDLKERVWVSLRIHIFCL